MIKKKKKKKKKNQLTYDVISRWIVYKNSQLEQM